MKIIGLTGNIACGKSMVADMLRELGAEVLDLDKVAHQLMAKGTDVYKRIVAEFGKGILAANGEIDRGKLGAVVFAEPERLARLEAIVHPAVSRRTGQLMRESQARVFVVEAIKLIEAGMHRRCDALWVVICPQEQQVARLVATRGLTPSEALTRIRAQPPAEEKLPYATGVINNDGTPQQLRAKVREEWEKLVGKD